MFTQNLLCEYLKEKGLDRETILVARLILVNISQSYSTSISYR